MKVLLPSWANFILVLILIIFVLSTIGLTLLLLNGWVKPVDSVSWIRCEGETSHVRNWQHWFHRGHSLRPKLNTWNCCCNIPRRCRGRKDQSTVGHSYHVQRHRYYHRVSFTWRYSTQVVVSIHVQLKQVYIFTGVSAADIHEPFTFIYKRNWASLDLVHGHIKYEIWSCCRFRVWPSIIQREE